MTLAITDGHASRSLGGLLGAILAAVALLAPGPAALAAGDADQAACPVGTEASPGFRSYLPDCRAYELVTPPYTEGYPVHAAIISQDGSRVLDLYGGGVFAGAESDEGGINGMHYVLARTPLGWSAAPINPPPSDPRFQDGFAYVASSADLTASVWEGDGTGDLGAALYLREESAGEAARYSKIGPAAGTLAGASGHLAHVLLTLEGSQLFPGDQTRSGPSLYEYAGVGNTEPRLVGVRNVGTLHGSPHVNEGAGLISECGTQLGSGSRESENAVSESGETVFFTALHGSCSQPAVNELYARIAGSATLDISEPILPAGEQCTASCASAARSEGVFAGASANGSKVFFLTSQPLIDNDRDSTVDLYEAELRGAAITRLVLVSEGETHATSPEQDDPTPGEGADVQGVVRVSQDGSRVYFLADGVLTDGPNSEGARALPGARNLYVFDTLTGRTAFVATLQSEAQETAAEAVCSSLITGEEHACLGNVEPSALQIWRYPRAQASPEGRYLLFPSIARLTADDTSAPLAPQLFRYDAQDGQLVRVSIGHDGFAQDGNTSDALDAPHAAGPSNITAEGAVFFESEDQLAPQALSAHNNVYEFQDGNVYLISDGQDTAVNSNGESVVRLLGVDASGQDVFFTTADQLVPQATGSQVSLYDARLDGGFPPPVSPMGCDGACQSPGDFTPVLGSPASASYAGGENAPPPAAPRPKSSSASRVRARAQELARALKACRRRRGKRRTACERRARIGKGAASSRAASRAGARP